MAFPKHYIDSVLDIDPEWIKAQGKICVLIDLDNTLLPRDTSEFTPEIMAWVKSLYDADLKVCLLSNNWHERVHTAAAELNMKLVSKAVKPLPPAFFVAMKRVGGKRKETIMIGDQLFTDVLGSAILGIPCIMVKPLAAHDLKHTLLLRNVERFVMRGRQTDSSTTKFK
ncbi:MAG: YqeG family HAD IIIA-type phosphatase [Coriobacteriia bacterium]|nr:YqeG family HAD IIIA-type phosphatase [Coriobacteriia bacterium]